MRDFWSRVKIPKPVRRTAAEQREFDLSCWFGKCPVKMPPLTENDITKLREVLREALECHDEPT